jgi:hypothetical protein
MLNLSSSSFVTHWQLFSENTFMNSKTALKKEAITHFKQMFKTIHVMLPYLGVE